MLLRLFWSRKPRLQLSYVDTLLTGFQWLIRVTARFPSNNVKGFKAGCQAEKKVAKCCAAPVVCFRETLIGVETLTDLDTGW